MIAGGLTVFDLIDYPPNQLNTHYLTQPMRESDNHIRMHQKGTDSNAEIQADISPTICLSQGSYTNTETACNDSIKDI